MKNMIFSQEAPLPIIPYNQAIEINRIIFLSVQIPINSKRGELVKGGIIEQTQQNFKNIE